MVIVEWILVARHVTKAANLYGNVFKQRPSILLSRFEVLKHYMHAFVCQFVFVQ